ncbi:ATP-dependent helicase [uncultured Methanolobus sp.]|uniref:ATP-dependent helicase n=1 Tax=uncultured Methanolobus sp. TaxID=218300 RepID=UPI0029C987A2|nr:ATP-dependent helicase [uncultured Methanolobus sp.]
MTREKYNAPPGCGKTSALMAKFFSLINSEGYRADDITCTTFRKSAANDLRMKVNGFGVEESTKEHIGTTHAICYGLLGRPPIIDAGDINHFAKECGYEPYMRTNVFADDEETVYSGKLLDLYTWLMNTQMPVEKWYLYPGADNILLPESKVSDFIIDYERFKQKRGKIDFPDMPEMVLKMQIPLDTTACLMDEFQDQTRQLCDVSTMWAKECESVTIAGDPLQSIYGFWGGSPDHFHQWEAKELIQDKSYRLLEPVWNLAVEILKNERQYPPEVTAREATNNPIRFVEWNQTLPEHPGSELHLVRCNYQTDAIAMQLATRGHVFGGLRGWDDAEISLANAIIRARTGAPLMPGDMRAMVDNFPYKFFKFNGRKADFIEFIKLHYRPTLSEMNPHIKEELYNLLKSDMPAAYINCGKLMQAKINGILQRKRPILSDELQNRQVLTIHGAKGLEADTVYLHTGITPKIHRSLVLPGEDSQAEARVWYVGVTRTKQRLYLVKDVGYNYPLPGVAA